MPKNALSFRAIEAAIRQSPALPDIPDERDFLAGKILTKKKLPASFSLREEQSPVKAQGERGTCTAFTVTAVAEYFNRAEFNDPTLDLSEEFVFRKTKEMDQADHGYTGYGAYLRSAAKAYERYGMCRERTLPYRADAAEDSWMNLQITGGQEEEAQTFRAAHYASVETTEEAICQALVATRAPLLAGFMLFESYRKSKETGAFPVPAASEKKIGGHAMCVVGYTPTHFILKNSWGTGWGDGGYCYWPRAAMQHVYSVWSFVDAENPNIKKKDLLAAMQARVPDWSRDSVAWAVENGIMQQIHKEPIPDYRLVTILHNFEKHLDKKYAKAKARAASRRTSLFRRVPRERTVRT